MRISQIFILLVTLIYSSSSFGALPGLVDVGSGQVRYLGLFEVYNANLLTAPNIPRDVVLDSTTSKCLILKYTVSLDAEDLVKGGEVVLSRQHDQQKLAKVQNHIDTLHNSYNDIKSGDSYSLCYDSSKNITTLEYNKQLVASIESREFANIYFGIWLGPEEPIDENLRNDLLKHLPSS